MPQGTQKPWNLSIVRSTRWMLISDTCDLRPIETRANRPLQVEFPTCLLYHTGKTSTCHQRNPGMARCGGTPRGTTSGSPRYFTISLWRPWQLHHPSVMKWTHRVWRKEIMTYDWLKFLVTRICSCDLVKNLVDTSTGEIRGKATTCLIGNLIRAKEFETGCWGSSSRSLHFGTCPSPSAWLPAAGMENSALPLVTAILILIS